MDVPIKALQTGKIMINPHVQVTHCSGDEVLVKHGSRSRFSHVIRDDGRTKLLAKVLRHLNKPVSLKELQEQQVITDSEVDEALALIDYLKGERVVISPDEYLPHVYLSMVYGKKTSQLAERTVGIVGSGYLGSRIARELSRLKVKELVLLDDRQVGPLDSIYFDLSPKFVQQEAYYAESVQQALNSYGYDAVQAQVAAMDDPRALTDLFFEVDFVIVALEGYSPQILHTVNQVALAMRKPWISVYVDGSEAIIGPIYVPGETLCYNEFEIQHEASTKLKDEYLLYKESLLESSLPPSQFVLPPYLSLINGWASTALLPFLISGQSFAVARCVRVDFERVSVDYEDVLKLPRCPACKMQQPGYRHTFL